MGASDHGSVAKGVASCGSDGSAPVGTVSYGNNSRVLYDRSSDKGALPTVAAAAPSGAIGLGRASSTPGALPVTVASGPDFA